MPAALPEPVEPLPDFGVPPATLLIAGLESAYRHLDACIGQLAEATTGIECDGPAFAAARFRISQASLARRHILQKACAHLAPLMAERHHDALKTVHRQDLEWARRSTEHIRDWPASRIAGNWRLYCEASRDIRSMMHAAMRAEQRLIIPLLKAYA